MPWIQRALDAIETKVALDHAGTAKCNPNTRYDYYVFGGHWDGQVGNKMDIHDKQIHCFALITPDGKWHASAEDVWSPKLTTAKDRRWRKQVERLLIEHSDCLAIGLD